MDDYHTGRGSANYFMELLKTVAVALIVTFFILLAAALLLCFTDFPEKYTIAAAIAGTILGVFTGSSMSARKNPEKGLASGLLTAFIYIVIAYIIGSILQAKVTFTLNTALFGLMALVTGAIASILANREKRSRKMKAGGLAESLKKSHGSYKFSKSGRL